MNREASPPILPETIPEELVAAYHRDGFLHVPGVLDAAEITGCLAEAKALLAREKKVSWDDAGGNVMDWIADPEIKGEAMRRLALHPKITGIAERLAGIPLRLFKSELLLKRDKGSASTPFHVDEPAFPFSGRPVTLTAWVALVDVPVEKGCMIFIPGSHLKIDLATGNAWTPMETWPWLQWEPRVTVPLRAGDCTFHHARVVHAAENNRTGEERISLATVYMDAESRHAPVSWDSEEGEDWGVAYQDSQPSGLASFEPGQPLRGERFPVVGSAAASQVDANGTNPPSGKESP
jgi:phytanoyl-CoA hydroxylase